MDWRFIETKFNQQMSPGRRRLDTAGPSRRFCPAGPATTLRTRDSHLAPDERKPDGRRAHFWHVEGGQEAADFLALVVNCCAARLARALPAALRLRLWFWFW